MTDQSENKTQSDTGGDEAAPTPGANLPAQTVSKTAAGVESDQRSKGSIHQDKGEKTASENQKETLDAIRKGERLALIIAGIVALTTIAQLGFTIWNSIGSTHQTDKLIAAADRNAAAAEKFKTAAEGINIGVGDAGKKLGVEASNIEAARQSSVRESEKTLEATLSNSRAETSAYIVTDSKATLGNCQAGGMHTIPCAIFKFSNIGQTPATNVAYVAAIKWDSPTGGGGISSDELRNLALFDTYTGVEGDTVGAKAEEEGTAKSASSNHPCFELYHGAPCGHTVYGIIDYKDIFNRIHETGFCVYYLETPSEPPKPCKFGNWFDVRPEGYPPLPKHQ